jgi:hypothetical protein
MSLFCPLKNFKMIFKRYSNKVLFVSETYFSQQNISKQNLFSDYIFHYKLLFCFEK